MLEIGLGEAKTVKSLQIHWSSGAFSRFDNIAPSESLHVIEGQAELVEVPR
jgi:hypothetical protein